MRKFFIFYLSLVMIGAFSLPVKAYEGDVLGLAENQSYDIYIGVGTKEPSVIRSVYIVSFREIQHRIFLVIQTDTFDTKRSVGLVAFESIQAILPSHKAAQIQGVDSVRYIQGQQND